MEMTKKIYLETLKSVLGRSILHYSLDANFVAYDIKSSRSSKRNQLLGKVL